MSGLPQARVEQMENVLSQGRQHIDGRLMLLVVRMEASGVTLDKMLDGWAETGEKSISWVRQRLGQTPDMGLSRS